MSNNFYNNPTSDRFRTGNFHSNPSSNINLGAQNRTFFEAYGVNPDQAFNPYEQMSGGDPGNNNVFYGKDTNISNGKADLKSMWRDLKEVKNIHIFNFTHFNQELAVVYNTNQVQYLTNDKVARLSCTKVNHVTNRTRFREFMLATESRRQWVPRYWKSERGRSGKSLYCPLYDEKFWIGLIFTKYEEEFNSTYLKSIFRRNLKLGEFNLEIGYNQHIYSQTQYDNVYLNGENKKFNKNLRRKATNHYLLQNCPEFKNKMESGLVKNYVEYLTKYIVSSNLQLESYEQMDKAQLLNVINQHNGTFNAVAENWGQLNQQLNLHQQMAETINPNLKLILDILSFFGIRDISSFDTRLLMDERAAHNIKSELGDIKLNIERGDFNMAETTQIKNIVSDKIRQVLSK